MSRTIRWYRIKEHVKKLLPKRRMWIHPWKDSNPFFFRHEKKIIRVKIHRAFRRGNKIRLQKGWDIEKEIKTNGWLSW